MSSSPVSDRSGRKLMIASDPEVIAPVSALLSAGAVDAVVAAVFVAAAIAPDVLLGPVQILLGGAGMGLRAVDGRTRQPGKGTARPRGFLPSDVVPLAAEVGVPTLVPALAATLALTSTTPLSRALAPAIAVAGPRSKLRAEVLERIARRGPAAMSDDPIAGELVAAAGRVAGGILTGLDLREVRPEVVPLDASRSVLAVPWQIEASASRLSPTSTRLVAALDDRGRVAMACYESATLAAAAAGFDAGGLLMIPALDLAAPRSAVPVLRGETRVRPGTARPAPAPMAILQQGGAPDAIFGARSWDTFDALAEAIEGGVPIEIAVRNLPNTSGTERPIGLVRSSRSIRPLQ